MTGQNGGTKRRKITDDDKKPSYSEIVKTKYGGDGIEMLRDSLYYFNSRVEERNKGKSIEELFDEYAELLWDTRYLG